MDRVGKTSLTSGSCSLAPTSEGTPEQSGFGLTCGHSDLKDRSGACEGSMSHVAGASGNASCVLYAGDLSLGL